MAGIFLNGGCLVWVYVISCLKFFDGGDSKPAEDFSNSPGRRRRSSRQFVPIPQSDCHQPAMFSLGIAMNP
jgi:hypothetical protein